MRRRKRLATSNNETSRQQRAARVRVFPQPVRGGGLGYGVWSRSVGVDQSALDRYEMALLALLEPRVMNRMEDAMGRAAR